MPIPAEYVGMTIDLGDSYDLPGVTDYRHVASITFGSEEKAGYDWYVDADDVLTLWNDESGDTWTLQWLEEDDTLLLTLDQTDDSGNPIVLFFPWSWGE